MANEDYERFAAFACERRDWTKVTESCRDICERLGVDHARLEETLAAELGMSGEEVLSALRGGNSVKQSK